MNKVRAGSLALLLALGCGGGLGNAGSGHPNLYLYWDSEDGGSSLVLEWYDLEDALLYKIYTSEGFVDYTTGTSYTLTQEHACSWVAVAAVLPEGVVAETVNIADYVVQSSVSGWGEMTSGHPPAVGFAYGWAYLYPIDSQYYRYFDIVLDDGVDTAIVPQEIDLRSPSSYSPPFNFRRNAFAPWPTSGDVAPAPEEYRSVYPDSGGIEAGASYALWVNWGYEGWDPSDHFVRIDINNIAPDGRVEATFYYQTIGGLRWVPVE